MKTICLLLLLCTLEKAEAGNAQPTQTLNDTLTSELLAAVHRKAGIIEKPSLTIILFFDTRCSGCYKSLLQAQAMQQKFTETIAIVSVTKQAEEPVATFFNKHPKLTLPYIAADTFYSRLFEYASVPHVVWIQQDGTIRAITSSWYLTAENIQKMRRGEAVNLPLKKDATGYERDKPLLVENNGGSQDAYLYRSLFTGYLEGVPSGLGWQPNKEHNVTRVIATNTTLSSLYSLAHGEMMLPPTQIRLMLTDNSITVYPGINVTDRKAWEIQNYHCYELYYPSLERTVIREVLLQDIDRYFGTTSRFEKLKTACYVLRKKTNTLLQTSADAPEINIDSNRAVFVNQPAYSLVRELNKIPDILPVLDETKDRTRFSMQLHCSLGDIAALQRELQRYGLELVKTKAVLPILTITQKKQKTSKHNYK